MREHAIPPAPGSFVDVEGTPMHVILSGEGGPAVVLESGLGGSVVEWEAVASALSNDATVFRRDRPGLGWSPYVRRDRRALQATQELRAALRGAGVAPPYILVGHSLGAHHVRVFAALHPGEVAGVVLVDPTHEDLWERAEIRRPMAVVRTVLRGLVALHALGGKRVLAALYHRQTIAELSQPLTQVGRTVVDTVRSLGTEQFKAIRDEYDDLIGSCDEVREIRGRGFPQVPLTVLTQGRTHRSAKTRRIVDLLRDHYHADLVGLSGDSRHELAARSGHLIPIDQPEIVADAVRAILQRVAEDPKSSLRDLSS